MIKATFLCNTLWYYVFHSIPYKVLHTFLVEFFEFFFWGAIIKNVSTLCFARTSSLSPPFPSSTSNLFPSSFKVALVIWTRLKYANFYLKFYTSLLEIILYTSYNAFYPGTPPDSIWFAKLTSSLHTSNCHFRSPITPHNTFPVWTPIRISTFVWVACLTALK